MKNKDIELLKARRSEIKKQFEDEFWKAKTYSDMLQSWATYTGKLEAIIDTYEVQLSK